VAKGTGKKPSLLPREHGAYAQIIFPLITALALGGITPAALLLVAAAVTIFLAHEPLLVLLGSRGGRAKREAGAIARRRMIWLVVIGMPAGLVGLWLSPPAARIGASIPLALAVFLAPLVFRRQEKTALGELLVAVTLSATLIPVAVAGGAALPVAAGASAVWAIVFALGTLTVRGIIARAKKTVAPSWRHYIGPGLSVAAIALAVLLALADGVPALAAVAVVPTAVVALAFGLAGVHPRNLRRMGWSLVASNLAVLAALVLGLR
jgi:hypothetical protein